MGLPENLLSEFDRLSRLAARERGVALEGLVGKIFRRAHFEVRANAGAAAPRQTDIFAFSERQHFLIEVKWQTEPTTIGDLDALWSRLERGPSDVTGVLISMSGFSATAREEVRARRRRPVLLLGQPEFTDLVSGQQELRPLLTRKIEALKVDGVVSLDAQVATPTASHSRSLHEGPPYLVLADGSTGQWLTAPGSFGSFTFATSVTDPTWAGPESSVTLDVSIAADSQDELLGRFDALGDLGWLTNAGHWCVQQNALNWHGVGAGTLRAALEGWQERYAETSDLHYREEACYADFFADGYYTITFDVSADGRRQVWYAELSLQMSGVPIDRQPIEALRRALGDTRPSYFRVRPGPCFSHSHLRSHNLGRLRALAYVVLDQPTPDGNEQWVSAVALPNPLMAAFDGSRPLAWCRSGSDGLM